MKVVPAEAADYQPWLRLAREVEPLFGPMVDDPRFQHALQKNIDRGSAFCIRENDGPAGVPLVGGILWSAHPPTYTIGWLAITQHHRCSGAGRLLVEYVLKLVKPPAQVLVMTFGSTEPGGEAAHRFYEKLGFGPTDIPTGWEPPTKRQVFKLSVDSMVERGE